VAAYAKADQGGIARKIRNDLRTDKNWHESLRRHEFLLKAAAIHVELSPRGTIGGRKGGSHACGAGHLEIGGK